MRFRILTAQTERPLWVEVVRVSSGEIAKEASIESEEDVLVLFYDTFNDPSSGPDGKKGYSKLVLQCSFDPELI